ncbi:hypothetical protein KC361_g12 [Hortaea werneckii]|nr:hypothetical protein KC361_g12 [Hortaea werneckii]
MMKSLLLLRLKRGLRSDEWRGVYCMKSAKDLPYISCVLRSNGVLARIAPGTPFPMFRCDAIAVASYRNLKHLMIRIWQRP